MPFLLVLAISVVLLPAIVLLSFFAAVLADYLLGGGSTATTMGSNAEPRPQPRPAPRPVRAIREWLKAE